MVLICISLISDVKHLCVWLLVICIYFFEKCLIKFFAHFWIRLFVFLLLLSFRGSLYILNINSLTDMWCANIFFRFVGCIYTLLILSFDTQKFLVLMKSSLSTFCLFVYPCFWYHSQEIIAKFNAMKHFPFILLRVI